jgi:integrase
VSLVAPQDRAGHDERRADAQEPPHRRQRVLDATGNLEAVQKLLGHASIQTTGDIYADWDIDQLAATMADVLTGNSRFAIVPHVPAAKPAN